jgi:hypothetical protein
MQAGPYEMAWQLMDEHANDPCPNEELLSHDNGFEL